jgi:hypothetical protein
MGFENCKNAAQFPFMQPRNASLVSNATPFIYFVLNLLDTGRLELTIRISVVVRPLNFLFLIGWVDGYWLHDGDRQNTQEDWSKAFTLHSDGP